MNFKREILTIKRIITSIQVDGKTKNIEQDSAKPKSGMRILLLTGSFDEYFREVKAEQKVNKRFAATVTIMSTMYLLDEMGERMNPNYLTQ